MVASALLLLGALPLAIATWWSIVTPVLAILALLMGWLALRHNRPLREVTLPRVDVVRAESSGHDPSLE